MAILIDSYSESNRTSTWDITNTSSFSAEAQSFEGANLYITSAKFYIYKTGSADGTLNAKLYNHSGTFGTSSVPTGTALAVSDDVSVSSLPTSFGLTEFTFSGDDIYNISSGNDYVISLEITGNTTGTVEVGVGSESGASHSGNESSYSGSWIANEDYNVCFYVYGENLEIENLVSDFSGSPAYTTLWDENSDATETGGKLEIESTYSPTLVPSLEDYVLTGSSVYTCVDSISFSTNTNAYPIYLADADSNVARIRLNSTTLYCGVDDDANSADDHSESYNLSTTHKFLRIRESSSTIYFDRSADGSTWTNMYSTSYSSFDPDIVTHVMITDAGPGNPITMTLESVNVVESSGTEATSDRNIKTTGSVSSTSDRNIKTIGKQTTSIDRGIKVTGGVDSTADRNIKIPAAYTSATSDAKILTRGSLVDSKVVNISITGKQTTSVDRGIKIEGVASSQTDVNLKVSGVLGGNAEVGIKTSGYDSTTSDRSIKTTGVYLGNAERSLKIRGGFPLWVDKTVDYGTIYSDTEVSSLVSFDKEDTTVATDFSDSSATTTSWTDEKTDVDSNFSNDY